MDKQLKKEWLKALRSGKYRQADGALCITRNKRNSYCCLGVLARVAGAKFHGRVPYLDGIQIGGGDQEYLTPGFAGLNPRTQETLGSMNDEGHKFSEIADWIEKNL